jgi:hypothetical protein
MGLVWKHLHRLQPMQLFKHVLCYFLIFSYGWGHSVKVMFWNNGKNILQKKPNLAKKMGEKEKKVYYIYTF